MCTVTHEIQILHKQSTVISFGKVNQANRPKISKVAYYKKRFLLVCTLIILLLSTTVGGSARQLTIFSNIVTKSGPISIITD